jgi:hypothetical protein
MGWKLPHKVKYLEALGAIADNRVLINHNEATVLSSEKTKVYNVFYNPEKQAIIANDPMSSYNGTFGYPIIAYLIKAELIKVADSSFIEKLANIEWKVLATRNKNNWDAVLDEALSILNKKEVSSDLVRKMITDLEESILKLELKRTNFPR